MIVKLIRAARRRDLWLILRAYLTLVIVDLAIRTVGVLPIWSLIRRRFRYRTTLPASGEVLRLKRVVESAARHHLYPMRCLPQAVSLAWMLARRGLGVELRLGTRRIDGKLEAHAWLERSGQELFPAPNQECQFLAFDQGDTLLRTGESQPTLPPSSHRFTSKLYDLSVSSDLHLPGNSSISGPMDVELLWATPLQPLPFELSPETCLYRNADDQSAVQGTIEFHRHGEWNCLRCLGFTDFYFTDGRQITYFLEAGASTDVVIAIFLGPVCAVLSELKGRPCLHASAVRIGDVAVAFAGNSGTSKSSLAASLVNDGYALLNDDILPMTVSGEACFGVPGDPKMKLDAGNFRGLLGLEGPFNPVVPGSEKCWVPIGMGWGNFANLATALQVIYILEREPGEEGEIQIIPLEPAESLIQILRFSFCARLVERLDLQRLRLSSLAKILQYVQVRRLRIPSGMQHFGRIQAAILQDIGRTRSVPAAVRDVVIQSANSSNYGEKLLNLYEKVNRSRT